MMNTLLLGTGTFYFFDSNRLTESFRGKFDRTGPTAVSNGPV